MTEKDMVAVQVYQGAANELRQSAEQLPAAILALTTWADLLERYPHRAVQLMKAYIARPPSNRTILEGARNALKTVAPEAIEKARLERRHNDNGTPKDRE